MKKKMIVLEGPAGAGKSWNLRVFRERHPDIPLLERPAETVGKRSYDSELTPLKIDIGYILETIYSPHDVVLVDRFWINSMVYLPFRVPFPEELSDVPRWLFPGPHTVQRAGENLRRTINTLITAAHVRDWSLQSQGLFDVSFHVLLPTLEVLKYNRGRSGKVYPFDPLEELRRYQAVNHYWVNWTREATSVRMTAHKIDLGANYHLDYEQVQEALDNEVNDWRNHAE